MIVLIQMILGIGHLGVVVPTLVTLWSPILACPPDILIL